MWKVRLTVSLMGIIPSLDFLIARYADYLVDHLKDKLVINDVFSNATQLEGLTTWQEKLIVSQLYFLSEVSPFRIEFFPLKSNLYQYSDRRSNAAI